MELIQGRIVIRHPRQMLPGKLPHRHVSGGTCFLPVRGYRGNLTASAPESPSSAESCSYGDSISVGRESGALSLRRPVKRPKQQMQLDWQEGTWVREVGQGRPIAEPTEAEQDGWGSSVGGEFSIVEEREKDGGVQDTAAYSTDMQPKVHTGEGMEKSRVSKVHLQKKFRSYLQEAKVSSKGSLREVELSDVLSLNAGTDGQISFGSRGMNERKVGAGQAKSLAEWWLDENKARGEKIDLNDLEPEQYMKSLFEAGDLDTSLVAREESTSVQYSRMIGCIPEQHCSEVVQPKLGSQVDDDVPEALFEWAQKLVQKIPTSRHVMKKINVQELVGTLARVGAEARISAELDKYRSENGGLSELTASMLVVELSRTGKAKIALQVLKWLSKEGIQMRLTSYNSLLAGLVRGSLFEEAYEVFEQMKADDVKPSVYTYTSLMQVASRTKGYKATLRIFNEMVKDERCKPDVFAYNCLIASFGRAHKWKEVAQIWEKMKQDGCKEGMGTYCLLVSTFVQCDQFQLALDVYYSIIQRAWKPNKDIFKALVCACAKEGRWMLAMDFLDDMLLCGIKPPATVFNALLSSIAKSGETQLVFRGYECMRAFGLKPDAFTWCSLLSALNHAGEFDRAWQLFESMKDMDVKPSCEVYAAMLAICLKMQNWQTALRLVWEMEKGGLKPDVQIFTLVINTCEACAQAQVALEVYEHMLQIQVAPNCFTYASLIRVCGKAYNWHKARELFEELVKAGLAPNIYVYNALFHAYLKCGQFNFAKKLYWDMVDHGCNPDAVTKDLFAKHPAMGFLIR